MPFNRPTLSKIIDRTRGDIETRLPGADAALRHSVLDVLARAHGGTAAGLYGYLDYLARQLMPDTAEAEYLARWAAIWGISRKAASAATATVIALGNDGATIPADSQAQRLDGATYRVIDDAIIAGGTAQLLVEAIDSGPEANLAVNDELTLSSVILGVNAVVTVSEAGLSGAIEETDASLLDRLLARIRKPPQGGAAHDYVAWALAQPGVTRAWAWPEWMGIGSVGVSFVMDDRDNILPLAADVAAVQEALDILRPVTAELVVFAPSASPIDIVLSISPDTAATRAAIEGELADFFARDAEPGGTIYLSRLGEAISLSEGEFSHRIDLPDQDITVRPGELPMLGQVTFI